MCSCLSESTIFGNCNGRGSDGQISLVVTVSSLVALSLSFPFPCCSTPSWLKFQSLRSLFPCCKRRPALSFQLYLSIKYTALLSFCFSCVSFFFCSILSIYQLGHAPFFPSPPSSLPRLIPSSSDSSFFFFLLPLPLLHHSLPFSTHTVPQWTTHRPLLQPSILLTVLIWT
jgi:hypothetical protein